MAANEASTDNYLLLQDDQDSYFAIPHHVLRQFMVTESEKARLAEELGDDLSGDMYRQHINEFRVALYQGERRREALQNRSVASPVATNAQEVAATYDTYREGETGQIGQVAVGRWCRFISLMPPALGVDSEPGQRHQMPDVGNATDNVGGRGEQLLLLLDRSGSFYRIPTEQVMQHRLSDWQNAQLQQEVLDDVSGYAMLSGQATQPGQSGLPSRDLEAESTGFSPAERMGNHQGIASLLEQGHDVYGLVISAPNR